MTFEHNNSLWISV